MTPACDAARTAILERDFTGWRGLPACTPEALFGIAADDQWGELPIGDDGAPALSRLLDIDGYYRPLAYVRGGSVVMFDGTNPVIGDDWSTLAATLGPVEAARDWIHSRVPMPGGERIYASNGITAWLNPGNDFVIHVSLYAPTSIDNYIRHLRPERRKP